MVSIADVAKSFKEKKTELPVKASATSLALLWKQVLSQEQGKFIQSWTQAQAGMVSTMIKGLREDGLSDVQLIAAWDEKTEAVGSPYS